MSIIERALKQVKGSPAATASVPAAKPTVETTPQRTRAAPEIEHIDVEQLRAEHLLVPEEHTRRLTEQMRRIKWPLLRAMALRRDEQAPNHNVLMIASSLPGEGKSFTAFNLARSFARERERSVLLIDGDVAKGQL